MASRKTSIFGTKCSNEKERNWIWALKIIPCVCTTVFHRLASELRVDREENEHLLAHLNSKTISHQFSSQRWCFCSAAILFFLMLIKILWYGFDGFHAPLLINQCNGMISWHSICIELPLNFQRSSLIQSHMQVLFCSSASPCWTISVWTNENMWANYSDCELGSSSDKTHRRIKKWKWSIFKWWKRVSITNDHYFWLA